MQHRTIIALPPPDQGTDSYRQAAEQAGLLVAVMRTDSGKIVEASSDSASKYAAELGDNTVAIRLQPAGAGAEEMLMRWYIKYPRRRWNIGKPRIDASLYERGLIEFLTDIEKDSAKPTRSSGR